MLQVLFCQFSIFAFKLSILSPAVMVLSSNFVISWFMLKVYHHVCLPPLFLLSLPLVNHCVFSLNSLLVPLFSSQVSGCYVCSLVLSSHRALPASAACVILVCPLFFLLRCVLCLVFCLWIMPVLLQAFFLGFWNVCTLIFPKKLMRDENRPMNKNEGRT